MGKPSTSRPDSAARVHEGQFSATTLSSDWFELPGAFNIALTGTGSGPVQLEKSFDGGQTPCPVYAGGTQLYAWSYAGSAFSEVAEEFEEGVLHRLRCTTAPTGAVSWRLSQ